MPDRDVFEALNDALLDLEVPNAKRRVETAQISGNLDLSDLPLRAIPDEVFQLGNLRVLSLQGTGVARIPDDIARLTELEVLEFTGVEGQWVSPLIVRLTKLARLSIGGEIGSLPPEMGDLRALRSLDLKDVSILPDWVFRLHRLEHLWAGSNLSELPDEWGNLTFLYHLVLRGNPLRSIPDSLGRLDRLRHLDLSDCGLDELPMALRDLTDLREARLGGNRFDALPEVVLTWEELEILDLNSDPTVNATFGGGGVRLFDSWQSTDERIAGAGLASLPRELMDLPELGILILHGNPKLRIPTELLGDISAYPGIWWDKSVHDILEYYFRSKQAARPLNEAKLVLVGWGGVGKTSLVKRLLHDEFEAREPRTEGIEVSSWEVDLGSDGKARLNVWDFGGQEIMHATHQFFLTTRALYVLVLNGRSGSADSDADYWLRVVSSFAAGSPIVVVLNQVDLDPFELDESGLRRRFPDVKAFVRTDCATALGIDDLRAEILRQTSNLPDLRVSFPASWFAIKDRLAAMAENYLTFETYRRICADLGEAESQAQDRLANYLHSLGIALNYRDDPRLRDTHVLNPHWVTEGIYTIVNSRLVAGQAGEVATGQLAEILDPVDYPVERHVFLLDLMRKFELCFPFAEDEGHYLIADLLPKQQPADADDYADGLRFEYHYPVLPEGLLPRFIVRTHIWSSLRWRSGCVLRWEGNFALVRADAADRRVRIWVGGPQAGRRRLLAVVRSHLDHIHSGYRFKVEAWVPVGPEISVQYEELLAAERAGMRMLPRFASGEMRTVDVAEVLQGVNAGTAGAKVFISYSHKDERHKDDLVNHLKVLQLAGLVDVWHDRRIGPGADWAVEIDDALAAADIVLFLVSADFLASDYCRGIEVATALRRRERGEAAVVPVIVRDANWRASGFAHLQALPTNGRAITTWKSRDTAWRIVSEQIEKLAREQLEKS